MMPSAGMWWHVKLLAEHATGWPMDTLHVLAGPLLQLLFAALMRRSVADKGPWLLVLVLELANEFYDLWFDRWPSLPQQLGEGLRDLIGTMFIPTLLLLVARHRPTLMTGRR